MNHAEKRPLPEGWQWVRIEEVCEFSYGSGLPTHLRQEGMIPVYGSNGIVGYHDQAITTGPTIIIGRKGSIGEVHFSLTPCWPIDTTYFIHHTIDVRINNATVRVKKGEDRTAEYIRAKETEKQPGGRFRLIGRPSTRPEYLDGRWPKCS